MPLKPRRSVPLPVVLLESEPRYRVGGRELNRFDLYERCVQSPMMQARFLDALHADEPQILADDFSGPAGIARAWLAHNRTGGAIATDLDELPLAHAFVRLTESLGESAIRRFALQHSTVLEAGGHADIIGALNFAACELHTRAKLTTYLRHCLFRLNAGGIVVLDTYFGPSAFAAGRYEQTVDIGEESVEYIWQQVDADPLSARVQNAIHFELPGNVRIDDAFVYDWRLWSVPELREAMRDVGFARTEVHLDYGDAIDERGMPLVTPAARDHEASLELDPDEDHVAYVVGRV